MSTYRQSKKIYTKCLGLQWELLKELNNYNNEKAVCYKCHGEAELCIVFRSLAFISRTGL